MPAETEYFNWD